MEYRLTSPCLLDPFWFNRVRHGLFWSTVEQDGQIDLLGEALCLIPRDALPCGTVVRVQLNGAGFFVCESKSDVEAAQVLRDEQEKQRQERDRLMLNELRTRAQAINASIQLPVQWDVGIKDVLSGLSEGSMGSGRNKATVHHIVLLDDLATGRLRRRNGDLLCTSASGSNGKRWSSKVIERASDGDGNEYQPGVTCKACLARAKQWIAGQNKESEQ